MHRYGTNGIRIFEGRFDEIIERHESRAIAAESETVATRAEQIELVTESGQVVLLTADEEAGGIRIERT